MVNVGGVGVGVGNKERQGQQQLQVRVCGMCKGGAGLGNSCVHCAHVLAALRCSKK